MPNPIQILRTPTAGARPTGKLEGEPFVNMPDRAFGVVDATGAAIDLTAVRYWSELASYARGDHVLYEGGHYVASIAVPPSLFNIWLWTPQQPHGDGIYFVDAAGNDANDGSQAAPWLTIKRAFECLARYPAVNGTVRVEVSAGVFGWTSSSTYRPKGAGIINIVGAGSTLTNVEGFAIYGNNEAGSPTVQLNKMMLQVRIAASGAVMALDGAVVMFGDPSGVVTDFVVDTLASTIAPFIAKTGGRFMSMLVLTGGIELRQAGRSYPSVVELTERAGWVEEANWTLTGTPDTCSLGFFAASGASFYTSTNIAPVLAEDERGGAEASPLVFTGVINGPRFWLSTASTVWTKGKQGAAAAPPGGLNFFPGTAPGTWDSSSSYDGVQGGVADTVSEIDGGTF